MEILGGTTQFKVVDLMSKAININPISWFFIFLAVKLKVKHMFDLAYICEQFFYIYFESFRSTDHSEPILSTDIWPIV